MALFRILIAAVFLVTTGFMPAAAQQPSEGAGFLGKSRSEYSVYVFGDELSGGLWAGSRRVTKGNPRLKTKVRFKEGSGLARPRFHDWAKSLPKIIERNPMDIAVVLIGSNDSQSVRQADGKLEFGSEDWREYYKQRIDTILSIFRANKIAVYWVELPPMGSAKHDIATKLISSLHRERVQAARQRFIELRKVFSNEDGTYTDKGFDVNGDFTRLRARNGIHFLKSGNTKIAKIVFDAINVDIEVSDGVRQAEPDLLAAGGETQVDLEGKPVFGHSLNSGLAFTLDPAGLPKADAVTIARANLRRAGAGGEKSDELTGDAVIEALRTTAIPGSAAGRLFVDGEWPEVPAGRVDDFSWSAE